MSPKPAHLSVTEANPPHTEGLVLLRVTGEVDAHSAPPLRRAVLGVTRPDVLSVILDLAGVAFISAAGVRALADLAARLAETGRRLLLARCTPWVRDVMHQVGALLVLEAFPSVDAATSAHRSTHPTARPPAALASGAEDTVRLSAQNLTVLRQRARSLPGLLQTRPLIAAALAELRDRYRLADEETAFALLRDCSQRHNVKLRALASAFIAAPPARPWQRTWFAGRRRFAAPPVSFARSRQHWRTGQSAFLVGVLDAALAVTGSDQGYVQLVDPFLDGLRLESQRGMPGDFARLCAYLGDAGTTCTAALRCHRPVSADLDDDAVVTNSAVRSLLSAAGASSAHSVPMLTDRGRCVGVVSTLDQRPAGRRSVRCAAALDIIARESGRWLDWHQRTVVLDALEQLHQLASSAGRSLAVDQSDAQRGQDHLGPGQARRTAPAPGPIGHDVQSATDPGTGFPDAGTAYARHGFTGAFVTDRNSQ